MHPDIVVEPVVTFAYYDDMLMDWLPGYDLVREEEILVPASIALFRYTPPPPAVNPFAFFHTNGLASGNVLEEAVCHALCEVIERDAMSLADLRASAIPFHILRTIVHSLNTAGFEASPIPPDRFIDDQASSQTLTFQKLTLNLSRSLVNKSAGIFRLQ